METGAAFRSGIVVGPLVSETIRRSLGFVGPTEQA